MENKDTGLLYNKNDIELHRGFFEELVMLKGVNVLHRAPLKGAKERDLYGELSDEFYATPKLVGCLFEEHPDVKTMRKLGWNTERNENKSIIHVPYNLNVEVGSLFIIPGPLDNTKGRVFQVCELSSIMIYPASLTCELVPYIKSNISKANTNDYTKSNFNILVDKKGED